jgi:hypothetical protein
VTVAQALFCVICVPKGGSGSGYCEDLEFELHRETTKNCVAFVLFDGAEWVIKHPRTYPRPLAFANRDDALREAVSLAAALSLLMRP